MLPGFGPMPVFRQTQNKARQRNRHERVASACFLWLFWRSCRLLRFIVRPWIEARRYHGAIPFSHSVPGLIVGEMQRLPSAELWMICAQASLFGFHNEHSNDAETTASKPHAWAVWRLMPKPKRGRTRKMQATIQRLSVVLLESCAHGA